MWYVPCLHIYLVEKCPKHYKNCFQQEDFFLAELISATTHHHTSRRCLAFRQPRHLLASSPTLPENRPRLNSSAPATFVASHCRLKKGGFPESQKGQLLLQNQQSNNSSGRGNMLNRPTPESRPGWPCQKVLPLKKGWHNKREHQIRKLQTK